MLEREKITRALQYYHDSRLAGAWHTWRDRIDHAWDKRQLMQHVIVHLRHKVSILSHASSSAGVPYYLLLVATNRCEWKVQCSRQVLKG